MCTTTKDAVRVLGSDAGKRLIQRIEELKYFNNLFLIPSCLPWRREKLEGYKDRWSVRVDKWWRIEFKAINLNEDLRLITEIKIMEVSNHYE